jgi:hypothetical protein
MKNTLTGRKSGIPLLFKNLSSGVTIDKKYGVISEPVARVPIVIIYFFYVMNTKC